MNTMHDRVAPEPSGEPAFKHDCVNCTFLGRFNGHDLYHCMQTGWAPTVLARYGDEGSEYKSGLEAAELDIDLGEARRRAVISGLSITPWKRRSDQP